MPEDEGGTDRATPAGRKRAVFWTAALLAGVLAAGGGYLLGTSGGEDLGAARAEGERLGQAEGAARGAERGFEQGFAEGRREGYRETYRKTRRAAYERAVREGGETPAATESGE